MTATASTHPFGRGRALVVIPIALILLAIPILMFRSNGGPLIDDTRAYFGAGTADGVPTATSVDCIGSRTGSSTSSSRSIGLTTYACVIDIAAPKPAPQGDPFKTMPYDQAMAEWSRRSLAEIKRATDPANALHRIERDLPTNRTGTTPTLRRLSADGEPKRFGVVWGAGELAWRWARVLLLTALFWGLALGILVLARRIWRRK